MRELDVRSLNQIGSFALDITSIELSFLQVDWIMRVLIDYVRSNDGLLLSVVHVDTFTSAVEQKSALLPYVFVADGGSA